MSKTIFLDVKTGEFLTVIHEEPSEDIETQIETYGSDIIKTKLLYEFQKAKYDEHKSKSFAENYECSAKSLKKTL